MATLGQVIVKARIDQRMTQKMLYEHAVLTQPFLSALEHDKVDPRFSVLLRIAQALQLPVCDLVREVTYGDE